MDGDFSNKQPKFTQKKVLIEWDGVLSLNPKMTKPLFNLLKQTGVDPTVLSFRKESNDNSDIFEYIEKDKVLFSNYQQKKDVLQKNNIKTDHLAYWIESDFRNVVDKENIDKLSSLLNNGFKSPDEPKSASIEKPYVFLDWDETMSLRPDFTERFFHLFKEHGFTPKIFTARREKYDNSDIFLWVDEKDVLFANGKQKKDAMAELGINVDDVAFWLDDSPQDIIAIKDFYYLFSYYND